jgi:transaldolase
MALLIDSAKIDEVKQAVELGFVSGVTTNPTLMAQVKARAQDVIADLCRISPGPVFYQLTRDTPDNQEREGREFSDVCREKVVLKIPCTTPNLGLMARLSEEIPCAATAVYSAYQALAAVEAGAAYLIPYVNRATRLLGDGCKLVSEIRAVVPDVRILAASIKSPDEAVAALRAGASDLTLPLEILLQLGNHPLSDKAIAEFAAAQTGSPKL